ncbi:hypothetical protein D3C72_1138270 [compost metagenome]
MNATEPDSVPSLLSGPARKPSTAVPLPLPNQVLRTFTSPSRVSAGPRVRTSTSPDSLLAPYRVPCGPRSTSTDSTWLSTALLSSRNGMPSM